jgi:biotin operon repressor
MPKDERRTSYGAKPRKATEVFLAAERDSDSITVSALAERFGCSRASISTAIKRMRQEIAGRKAA